MPKLNIGNREVVFTVIKSSRAKTIRITVCACSGVLVTVPGHCHTYNLKHILKSKADWIFRQLDLLSELAGCPLPRTFGDGDNFFFLGRRYSLKVTEGVGAIKLLNGEMLVPCQTGLTGAEKADETRRILLEWYRLCANNIIMPRIQNYARFMGVNPTGVKIKMQKTCWGSCTGSGNINLNCNLVMAPPEVIDYVIVHELCHLKKRDHSKQFWEQVEAVMPDYQSRRRWLKKYSPVLIF